MAIVGGGIVGLGTARALQLKYPDMSIVLLEKEKHLGRQIVVSWFLCNVPSTPLASPCPFSLTYLLNICS